MMESYEKGEYNLTQQFDSNSMNIWLKLIMSFKNSMWSEKYSKFFFSS